MIERYAKERPSRIRILPSDGIRLGVNGNFVRLLESADGPYFMFCDQDDVWLPRKIEKSMDRMRSLKRQVPPGTPLLVYADLIPVDSKLHALDTSMWRYGLHNPDCGKRINRLVVQNMVFGCVILMNDALKQAALPLPPEAECYDWWFALVAASLGRSDYVREPLLLYRLHGRNAVGATRWAVPYILGKLRRFFDPKGLTAALERSQRQADALLRRYEGRLSLAQREVLHAYATLRQRGFLSRRSTLLRHGLLKTGLIRNVGLLARI
jgi:glycosyltransferase involved in cell wall biosynthesis